MTQLSVLTESCLPLVRVGGQFVAMKGIYDEQEIDISKHAFITLGGAEARSIRFKLEDAGERTLILVEKVSATPPQIPP